MTDEVILQVKDLKTYFYTDAGIVKSVDGVSFDLHKGEILGIVGESGSGKSVSNLSIMNLIPSPPGKIENGEVLFHGEDLLKMSQKKLRSIRGNRISMIFQDPMSSLNPFLRISTQMIETIQLHQGLNKKDAKAKAIEMLKLAGIPAAEERIDCYPHQFSGGMKQRIVIAIALACDPILLIADEPTTALDVTIQAQVLEMMRDLKEKMNTSLLLITHDLGVVAAMCDKVAVMYAGEIVEVGPIEDIFENPLHPYTIGLFQSIQDLERETDRLIPIEGLMPDPTNLPSGCKFHTRCPKCTADCRTRVPETAWTEGHGVKCLLCGKTPNGDEHIE